MDYELAKELKYKGFPITEHVDRKPEKKEFFQKGDGRGIHDEYVYIPTLSELIEACGQELRYIKHHVNGNKDMRWTVQARGQTYFDETEKRNKRTKDTKAYGSTLEIAVARLWLALQAKE